VMRGRLKLLVISRLGTSLDYKFYKIEVEYGGRR
jgi:hypothetical protein